MLKKQSKKCIDWRQLETPKLLEESPAAPVADTTVVYIYISQLLHQITDFRYRVTAVIDGDIIKLGE